MRLDIYIEDKNLCIEYNGKQHYEYIPFFIKIKKHLKDLKKEISLKKNYLSNII